MLGLAPLRSALIASSALALSLVATPAAAALWEDATMATIGMTAGWSNKVELADINGDGQVDILMANGRGYASAEGPEVNYAFLNQGPGMGFTEVGAALFGAADQSRVIKAVDVDGDGDLDLFVGNTYQTQSRLYLGDGGGGFEEVTQSHLPAIDASIGDAEFGDVDGDGDLDLVLADWGDGNPSMNEGGPTRLWLNDGGGVFSEAPGGQIPGVLVRWSWELELVDVDNDLDLDVAVSCKSCAGSFLFLNDGAGKFSDASEGLPQFSNNYEFEALDLSGDGFVDLVTINDRSPGNREHVFIGDGAGAFVDETPSRWPDSENPAGDDNMIAFLDVDSDGDADFLIAGLFGQIDRLITNKGGQLSLVADAFAPATSPGTLGIAVADLDGDHRLDVVMAEGEAADPDFVFLGVDLPPDTAPPRIDLVEAPAFSDGEALTIRARIHDNKTPLARHDFASVVVRWSVDDQTLEETAMTWYGGLLWRATLPPLGPGSVDLQVCAIDAAGNDACSDPRVVMIGGGGGSTGGSGGETSGGPGTSGGATGGSSSGAATGGSGDASASATDTAAGDDGGGGGCGCRSAPAGGSIPGALVVLVGGVLRRRRR
ncbi:MAG: VCBS repeat-containing protein [Myxococcales bacterium]|nr:VCBS repeat-containing protein [Myxococcales bacterium]